jgi:hypothetical protein
MRHKAAAALGYALFVLALTACSSGPSEADIEATVEARVAEERAAVTLRCRVGLIRAEHARSGAGDLSIGGPRPHDACHAAVRRLNGR